MTKLNFAMVCASNMNRCAFPVWAQAVQACIQ
jgi:hypothetical protein